MSSERSYLMLLGFFYVELFKKRNEINVPTERAFTNVQFKILKCIDD